MRIALLKKKYYLIIIDSIGLILLLISGFLPYRVNSYFNTYKTGFNLLSLKIILVALGILISIIPIYLEKHLLAILNVGIICFIMGIVIIPDLIFTSSPDYLSIGFYFTYISWLLCCLVCIYLFKFIFKLSKSDFYTSLEDFEKNYLSKLKKFYLIFQIIFFFLISVPFEFEYDYSGRVYHYSTGGIYAIIGGWYGIVMLAISYYYFHVYRIQKSLIFGFIGNFLIGLPLIGLLCFSFSTLAFGFLLSFILWLKLCYINIAQLAFLFQKYGFPKRNVIKLKWSKYETTFLKFFSLIYIISILAFIITTLFPYSPYSPAYDLSKVGFYYLWVGGWQGLFLVFLSVLFLYFYNIGTAFTLGLSGAVLIHGNFYVLFGITFLSEQHNLFNIFYISLSFSFVLIIVNLMLFIFQLKHLGYFSKTK